MRNTTITLLFTLLLVGCSEPTNSASSSSSSKSSFSVEGFYSGPGVAGWGGTVELYYGGSWIMKDPGLPGTNNGTWYGEWSGDARNITFYSGGATMFTGRITSSGDLNLGGRTYNRKR